MLVNFSLMWPIGRSQPICHHALVSFIKSGIFMLKLWYLRRGGQADTDQKPRGRLQ